MVLVVISSEVYNHLSCIGSEYFPYPVHLLSIILRICRFSSLMLLDKAHWSYSLSSHSKILSWSILVSDLVLRTVSIFLSVATCQLSPMSFIRVSYDNSGSPLQTVVMVPSVTPFVIKDFLRDWIVSPVPKSQPGGTVDHFSSDLYSSTCPALVAQPRDKLPPAQLSSSLRYTSPLTTDNWVMILQGDLVKM